MKFRKSGGKHLLVFFLFLFFYLDMSLELSGLLILRQELEGVSRDANDWILQHCFYCNN